MGLGIDPTLMYGHFTIQAHGTSIMEFPESAAVLVMQLQTRESHS